MSRIRHATEEFVTQKDTELKQYVATQGKVLDDKLNVLSVDRGYLISKKVSGDIRELNTNGKFWCSSSDTINLPPQTGGERTYTVDVTTYLPNRLTIELVCIYDSVDSSNHGVTFSSSQTSRGWTPWKVIATTDSAVLKGINNVLNSKGIILDTWGNCGANGGGMAWYGSNLYKDSDGKYKYVKHHPNGTGGAFECDIFSRKPFYIRCTDTSAMNGGIANVEKLEIATTNKTDISLLNGWIKLSSEASPTVSITGNSITLDANIFNGVTSVGTVLFTLDTVYRIPVQESVYVDALDTGGNCLGKCALFIKPSGNVEIALAPPSGTTILNIHKTINRG